jgi:PTS system mannose-specific IIB component/fructoselysine and glucoselysine-specific PTS system IIB component
LIHGQVVVGWGQALSADRFLLIDDQVASNEWERELYTMGVPPGVDVEFVTAEEAGPALDRLAASPTRTIVVIADVDTLLRACRASQVIHRVNVGGIHEREGRKRRLPYVFLTEDEAAALEELSHDGIEVTAQDVPSTRPVPLSEFA